MKKTPSALKWLAEKRARVAHDLELTARVAEVLNARHEKLKLDLAALDRAVTIYDPALDPKKIGGVNGWQGRYGKRGSMRAAIESVLKAHAPDWMATDNIEALVTLELDLVFEAPGLRKRWYDNSFTKQLRELVAEGLVERYHDATVATSEVGRWRWKQLSTPTLVQLREQADANP